MCMSRSGLRRCHGESDPSVALAVALVVRALRGGSVCVDLRSVEAQVGIPDLPWPSAPDWFAAVLASPLVGSPPVLRVYDGKLLYLDRYWREEQQVADDLLGPAVHPRAGPRFPISAGCFPRATRNNARPPAVALQQGLTVLTGGPGTGKTTTVARLLALFAEQAELDGKAPLRIALAAPTGKAAATAARGGAIPGRTSWIRLIGNGSRACMRRHCTGCWAAGRIRRRDFAIIGAIDCRTT